jgi:hypothetical protein
MLPSQVMSTERVCQFCFRLEKSDVLTLIDAYKCNVQAQK